MAGIEWQQLKSCLQISAALFPGKSAKTQGPALFSHTHNGTKLLRSHRHNRKTRLADKRNFLQRRSGLNLLKSNGSSQKFQRGEIDRAPIALGCSWVWISCPSDLGDADHSFFHAAMVKEDFVALSHSAQIISRCVISNARPVCLSVGYKI